MSTSARTNESLVAWVESIGGNYVWEPEVFVVSLEEVELKDEDVRRLTGLVGVQQLVLEARGLSSAALGEVAALEGLGSLVLANARLSEAERTALEAVGPLIEWL